MYVFAMVCSNAKTEMAMNAASAPVQKDERSAVKSI
jgi:hypothetical protein